MPKSWMWLLAGVAVAFGAGRGSHYARRPMPAPADSARAKLVEEVLSLIQDHYVDSLDDATLSRFVVEGIVARLGDPYSGLLDQKAFQKASRPSNDPPIATVRMLDDSIGLVRLKSISSGAAVALRNAIAGLDSAGMRGLVFDLRGNPGGMVKEGVRIADLFLDAGLPIGALEGRSTGQTEYFVSSGKQEWPDLPLVILIDRHTASAAELISGTLQEHDRALIVGSPTFGKGLAQTPYRLANGMVLKLTTGRWITPRGRMLDSNLAPDATYLSDSGRSLRAARGVTPDLRVDGSDPDYALHAALRLLVQSRSTTALFTNATVEAGAPLATTGQMGR